MTEKERLEIEYAYLIHEYEQCDEILVNLREGYASLGREIFEVGLDISTGLKKEEGLREKLRGFSEEIEHYINYNEAVKAQLEETLAKIEISYNLLPQESRLLLAQRN